MELVGAREDQFPIFYHGRSFKENVELILTTILLYKQNYQTLNQLRDHMEVYRSVTRCFDSQGIVVNEKAHMDELQGQLLAINRVISTQFVRWWCLKVFRHLKSIDKIINQNEEINR